MNARDIAKALYEHDAKRVAMCGKFENQDTFAQAAWLKVVSEFLPALTAAGYRILAPGEIDPETRERCAKVAEDCGPATQDMTSTAICEALDDAASVIRSLGGPNDR